MKVDEALTSYISQSETEMGREIIYSIWNRPNGKLSISKGLW